MKNSLTTFDNVEVGDYIEFPNSLLLVKSGKIAKIKGINGDAKQIWLDNGSKLGIGRTNDYVIWCD